MALHYRNTYQQRKAIVQEAQSFALTLAERYPMVQEITVRVRFVGADGAALTAPQNHSFKPDSAAHFEFPCPAGACTNGYFSLDFVIGNMLFRRIAEMEGKLYDKSGQDRNQADKHLCLSEMQYSIHIHYLKGHEAQLRTQMGLGLGLA